jgi:DNA-binding response OmpR family regulator
MQLNLRIQSTSFTTLIVEDEPTHADFLSTSLSSLFNQMRILYANNGMAALKVLAKEQPDLIITDWDMPQLNGIELIKKIREQAELADIPIIMVTAFQQAPEHLSEALLTGATDFIRKPIDPTELHARVQSALRLLVLHRDLAAEQQKLIREKTEALENINAQVMRKNRLIKELKRQAEDVSTLLNGQLMPHITNLIKVVNKELKMKEDLQTIDSQIRELHPVFWKKLSDKFPQLSRNEKYLCVHIYHGRTTQETADFLSISVRSVEMARYRLRKKLGLSQEQDMTEFLRGLV